MYAVRVYHNEVGVGRGRVYANRAVVVSQLKPEANLTKGRRRKVSSDPFLHTIESVTGLEHEYSTYLYAMQRARAVSLNCTQLTPHGTAKAFSTADCSQLNPTAATDL